eukprot:5263510-Alexandrium_andersonii.AAC.1
MFGPQPRWEILAAHRVVKDATHDACVCVLAKPDQKEQKQARLAPREHPDGPHRVRAHRALARA